MEAVYFSETLVSTYKSTQRYNSEEYRQVVKSSNEFPFCALSSCYSHNPLSPEHATRSALSVAKLAIISIISPL
jgi:hypothetical protein